METTLDKTTTTKKGNIIIISPVHTHTHTHVRYLAKKEYQVNQGQSIRRSPWRRDLDPASAALAPPPTFLRLRPSLTAIESASVSIMQHRIRLVDLISYTAITGLNRIRLMVFFRSFSLVLLRS